MAEGTPEAGALATIAELVEAGEVVVPGQSTKVYKDECMFSFANPRDGTGIYLNLKTAQAFGPDFVALDRERNGNQKLYLHIKWDRVLKDEFKEAETAAAAAAEGAGDADMGGAADGAADGAAGATDGGADAAAAEGEGDAAMAPSGDAAGAGGDAGAGAVTKMAIGVEGGFQVEADKYRWDKHFTVVVAPEMTVGVEYPNAGFPAVLTTAIGDIIARTDAKQEAAALVWSEGEAKVSKYAENLVQLDTEGKTIPPSGWKCEMSGDTENLWLNLSTGYIGGGRKYFDGSGGSGGAMEHFEATGKKYPLVVKLGTITARGADVYSYADDEDCMVKDPWLVEHLKHWGIDAMSLKKTAKTMDELSIELNLNHEWGRLSEGKKKLDPLAGPGLVGLVNVGNSCYFNSVIQVLFALPEFKARYLDNAAATFRTAPRDPAADINTQMTKLAVALLTDKYVPEDGLAKAKEAQEAEGKSEEGEEKKQAEVAYVEPGLVKSLLGQGHAMFSTGQQQDAQEYLCYLLEKLEIADRGDPRADAAASPVHKFNFKLETRLVDDQSGQVRYGEQGANMLSFTMPDAIISNAEEYNKYKAAVAAAKAAKTTFKGDSVFAKVSFDRLMGNYFADSTSPFNSPVTGAAGTATQSLRMKTFPKYLWFHLQKYRLSSNWTPEKLDSEIDFPMKVDLASFKGNGLQEGETEMKEEVDAAPEPTVDETVLAQILPFGFSENACRKACLATSNSVEAASNWLMAHMGDADFNDPPAAASSSSGGFTPNPDHVAMLTAMLGITARHAGQALEATGGSMERAADWALTHPEAAEDAGGDDTKMDDDGDYEGKYQLKAVISHIGTSPQGGHYVCHILKDGVWAFFNDASVAKAEDPPIKYGFMYLYERTA